MLQKSKLPDNIQELKKMIANMQTEYEAKIQEQEKELLAKSFEYLELEEKFQALQIRFFKRKSEKISDEEYGQTYLFNEAEQGCNIEEENQDESESISVKSHTRKKKRKETFPSNLPEKVVVHEGNKKECPCCGDERKCIGEEITREIDIIPEQIRIIKHVQKKYGPCECEEFEKEELPQVVMADKPKRMLPGIIASVGLLAYIFISKFMDSLPYYRLEKRFERLGINISRTNMCNWQISASRKCGDLINLMWEEARNGNFIQMDETSSQVLKEPGRPPHDKGYMFVTIGYTKEHKPIVLYHYHRTRNKKIVAESLKGFKGHLQSDGLNIYNEYNDADKNDDILRVGCGAHIRRKFFTALQLTKGKSGMAKMALTHYGKVAKIEKELRADDTLSHNDFVKKRRKLMEPVLDAFNKYLIKKQSMVPPTIKIGEAINYALKEWDQWIRFLDKWYITPDNNYAERKIKPYVIGRKNWFFSDTLAGVYSSSTMYSLIQTAYDNGLNVYWYLRYIFTRLPYAETKKSLRELLPMYVTKIQLVEFMNKAL